jgi:hypothetical protein
VPNARRAGLARRPAGDIESWSRPAGNIESWSRPAGNI